MSKIGTVENILITCPYCHTADNMFGTILGNHIYADDNRETRYRITCPNCETTWDTDWIIRKDTYTH